MPCAEFHLHVLLDSLYIQFSFVPWRHLIGIKCLFSNRLNVWIAVLLYGGSGGRFCFVFNHQCYTACPVAIPPVDSLVWERRHRRPFIRLLCRSTLTWNIVEKLPKTGSFRRRNITNISSFLVWIGKPQSFSWRCSNIQSEMMHWKSSNHSTTPRGRTRVIGALQWEKWRSIALAKSAKFTNDTVLICETSFQRSQLIVLLPSWGIWPKHVIFAIVCWIV